MAGGVEAWTGEEFVPVLAWGGYGDQSPCYPEELGGGLERLREEVEGVYSEHL